MRVIDLSTLSLVGGSGIAEAKIPLWWADGTYLNTGASASGTLQGQLLQDGSTSLASNTSSATKLFNLSTNWQSGQKFALEATFYASSSSALAIIEIWDFTLNQNPGYSSYCNSSNTTMTTIRSSTFSCLVPGRTYGISVYNNSSTSASIYVSDVSLIVFP